MGHDNKVTSLYSLGGSFTGFNINIFVYMIHNGKVTSELFLLWLQSYTNETPNFAEKRKMKRKPIL